MKKSGFKTSEFLLVGLALLLIILNKKQIRERGNN